MQAAVALKEKLARRELTLGMIITNHLWLELLEIAQIVGLDYVIVDMEHLQHDNLLVADACRIGRLTNFPVFIRPPHTSREYVRLAIDFGPCGLLLPMIETADQLDEIQQGLLMPPRGERRPGGHGNWWVPDFNYETWKREVEDNFFVMAQIESPLGVENACAIASHPITTALAIGPYDLSARLGLCWQPDHPQLRAAWEKIRAAADEAGKPMWAIGDGNALAKDGYIFICVAEPSNLLKATLHRLVEEIRSGQDTSSEAAPAFVP